MKNSIDSQTCDLLIRSGRIPDLYSYLERQRRNSLSPRDQLLRARCFRRVGELPKALKILSRLRKENHTSELSLEVQREYATVLIFLGLSDEALRIIQDLPESFQKIELLAQYHHEDWNAPLALENYLKALQNPDLDFYKKINLSLNAGTASLESQNWAQAERLFLWVMEEARNREFLVQHDFALEFFIELELIRGNFREAVNLSGNFLRRIEDLNSFHLFLRNKVEALVQAYTQGQDLRPLEKKAGDFGYYEMERHLKFHRYCLTRDSSLGHELYWGTKNMHFRSNLRKNGFEVNSHSFRINEKLEFQPERFEENILRIEVEVGNYNDISLDPKTVIGKLSCELLREIHKPLSLGQLFSRLFPDEKDLGTSSLNRVQQAIQRLKLFYKKNNLPLEVQERDGTFRLRILVPVVIDFGSLGKLSVEDQKKIHHFRSRGIESFLRKDWEKELQLSSRNSQRDLARLLDLGLIERSGKAKWVRYRFLEDQTKRGL